MSIIIYMGIKVRERIKSLLAERNYKMKDLAAELSVKSGKHYSLANLSSKLKRGTITYNEVILICDILDYDIEFRDRN